LPEQLTTDPALRKRLQWEMQQVLGTDVAAEARRAAGR
jgi:hypothetical protein